ncbi:trehalase-like [Euwallacea fornicatus]|uniref:trehalase-like n=1 Tax=Euwallacea fornicatus TaxID=995702 RepID=UPI00338F7529
MQRELVIVVLLGVLLAARFLEVSTLPLYEAPEEDETIDSCPSPVYCKGELLDVVQRAMIFNDSKTFVDMSQVNPVNVTLDNFWQMMNATNGKPTKADVENFVKSNFIRENETISWTPTDFNPSPAILEQISDEKVREFAKNLIGIWPSLGRKISHNVYENPEQHSILEVPNGFIVPGGRFKEVYYWDSYWIMKGLLLSEMYDTVRGMLENICHLIKEIGFMPNGSRKYYLNRSHPPVLTFMIQEYLKYTQDTEWLKNNIQCVEIELNFWLKNRTKLVEKNGVIHELAHYEPFSNTPRPESYSKDLETCNIYNETAKKTCYKALKGAAESGWDFSSRWFFDNSGGTETNVTHTLTQRVVPVDLNAILCKAFSGVAEFYHIFNDSDRRDMWQEKADAWNKSIEMVFYDDNEGIWLDYDIVLQRNRNNFYPSNFAPLWAKTYDLNKKDYYGKRATEYLLNNGIDMYRGGIPTSLDQSGEQWDFRNAWPPLQEFVVLGLLQTGNVDAIDMGKTFGHNWVAANMIGYNENKIMFEKYDALDPGKFGGGGEYEVQPGFGWTNGVALTFIDLFYTNK